MEDNEFKEYVVSALAEIINSQDQTQADLKATNTSVGQLQADMKEIKSDISRIDKKTDAILKYVEYIDADLQRHKKAEML